MRYHPFVFLFFVILLSSCREPKQPLAQQQAVRISIELAPSTLDTRRVRDLGTVTWMHMLYEGLMRTEEGGSPIPALAESVTVSPDKKQYTFHLRPSAWSNGDAVTAHDFEQTWKSLLNPQFPAPNAYQLYAIRGAQAAKEGRAPLEEVGVHATSPSTLVVELEQPIPYFLSLTATHFFYPVHQTLWNKSPDAPPAPHTKMITNGPFYLQEGKEMTAIPNPHYWDTQNVHLKKIEFILLDNPTALQLFQNGELEWTGSPLSTLSTDALSSLHKEGKLQVASAAGVFFLRVNTAKPPFNNAKMRRAFALALNRSDLVEHVLQGNQEPALGFVPPSFLAAKPYFADADVQMAQQLFQEALKEEGLRQDAFPAVAIDYSAGERPHKIAQVAQQQWKEILGVDVQLQTNEPKVFFDKLKTANYQLGIGSWFADFYDPISFLEVFKYRSNGTNNTQWENGQYISLLDASAQAQDSEQRQATLEEAQRILMSEMPILPLFFNAYNYVKDPAVKGVYFSELGYLDFKRAHIDDSANLNQH